MLGEKRWLTQVKFFEDLPAQLVAPSGQPPPSAPPSPTPPEEPSSRALPSGALPTGAGLLCDETMVEAEPALPWRGMRGLTLGGLLSAPKERVFASLTARFKAQLSTPVRRTSAAKRSTPARSACGSVAAEAPVAEPTTPKRAKRGSKAPVRSSTTSTGAGASADATALAPMAVTGATAPNADEERVAAPPAKRSPICKKSLVLTIERQSAEQCIEDLACDDDTAQAPLHDGLSPTTLLRELDAESETEELLQHAEVASFMQPPAPLPPEGAPPRSPPCSPPGVPGSAL